MTSATPLTGNKELIRWVDEWAAILQPDRVLWCDGSAEEYDDLCQQQRPGRRRHHGGVVTDRGQALGQALEEGQLVVQNGPPVLSIAPS